MRLSGAIANARTWLAAWWPDRARARELARQYKAMQEAAPLAVADLLRFCLLFDDHAGNTDAQSNQNIGKHQAGLHLMAMLNLEPEDLDHLRQETEDDGNE